MPAENLPRQASASTPPPGVSGAHDSSSVRKAFIERRLSPRFQPDQALARILETGLKARLKELFRKASPSIFNLSETGLRLVTPKRLEPGSEVTLSVEIQSLQEEFQSPGKVVWCLENSKKSHEFHSGILFQGLSPSLIKKIAHIREYLESAQYKSRRMARIQEKK